MQFKTQKTIQERDNGSWTEWNLGKVGSYQIFKSINGASEFCDWASEFFILCTHADNCVLEGYDPSRLLPSADFQWVIPVAEYFVIFNDTGNFTIQPI